jgi:hypothetical protein
MRLAKCASSEPSDIQRLHAAVERPRSKQDSPVQLKARTGLLVQEAGNARMTLEAAVVVCKLDGPQHVPSWRNPVCCFEVCDSLPSGVAAHVKPRITESLP